MAIVRFSDPLLKLDLQRLTADQPLERRDPRLVFAQQLGQRHDLSRNLIRIWVENAEAGSLDRDMASAECVQRLPGVALGNDLTLEVDAVTGDCGVRAWAFFLRKPAPGQSRSALSVQSEGRTPCPEPRMSGISP